MEYIAIIFRRSVLNAEMGHSCVLGWTVVRVGTSYGVEYVLLYVTAARR